MKTVACLVFVALASGCFRQRACSMELICADVNMGQDSIEINLHTDQDQCNLSLIRYGIIRTYYYYDTLYVYSDDVINDDDCEMNIKYIDSDSLYTYEVFELRNDQIYSKYNVPSIYYNGMVNSLIDMTQYN